MIRLLPAVIEVALLVYCLIDCLQTDSLLVRGLSKGWWIVLIIVMPLVGGIAWLVAGRPQRSAGRSVPWRATATAGYPEYERPGAETHASEQIDARLGEDQARVDREHEEALRQWEQSLREREQRLGAADDGTAATG